jgi:ketopantoate hydroxymethyltransferase
VTTAFTQYADEVRTGAFPAPRHWYAASTPTTHNA